MFVERLYGVGKVFEVSGIKIWGVGSSYLNLNEDLFSLG